MSTLSDRLAGKTIVVSGAGAGIGKGCAVMFARHGAKVVGVDLNLDAVARTQADAQALGLDITPFGGVDLTREQDVTQLAAQIGERAGRVHGLVNAAAFAVFAWIEELTVEDWRKTLACELDIVFLLTQALWSNLKAANGASLVNFASANAYHALPGSPALAHCAGKGGVLAMTRQLAMEGAPHGIRANTISPGFIRTEATGRHLEADPSFSEKVLEKNMIKRLGDPDDIAWLATYLLSGESTYVTGADFSVDAGATAW